MYITVQAIMIGLLSGSIINATQDVAQESSTKDHVVIVLDGSGSMDERMPGSNIKKMRAAKDALHQVLQQIPLNTRIGLLVFSGGTGDNPWIYPLGPRDDQKVKQAIEKPRAQGGTPLGRYIKIAADRLLKAKEADFGYGTYRLLIVTDGEAQDRNLVERYTPDVMARGITVDVIGVAMKSNHTLATKVHSYRRADDPSSLKRAIEEVFAEVGDKDLDDTGEDAFAVIAPLPDELALAMLQAVATTSTTPISGKTIMAQQSRSQQTAHSTHRSQKRPTALPVQGQSDGKSWLFFFLVAFVVIAAIIAIKSLRRARG
ncbi:MAG: vWA domain-containing protein [Planctomycetota bacterium]